MTGFILFNAKHTYNSDVTLTLEISYKCPEYIRDKETMQISF